jgi:hypothetical protein
LNVLYVEQPQQLVMQHPHHHSLGNVVMTGQLPGAFIWGSFYSMQNIFDISAAVTLLSTSFCHIGPHATCFSQVTF